MSAAAWFWILLSIVALIGTIGLYLHQRWAQYFWHGIALVACVWWVASVLQVAISGWPHQSIVSSLVSLLPGLLLLTVCIGGSFVIAKHYRRASKALTRRSKSLPSVAGRRKSAPPFTLVVGRHK